MDALKEFSFPLKGLSIGVYSYDFNIDKSFFNSFEDTLITNGNFKVDVQLDIRSSLIIVDIDIEGKMPATCDRCLNPIDLQVVGTYQMIVKYGMEDSDEEDVVYIEYDSDELNIGKYIYEYCCLSIPLSNLIDCGEGDSEICNQDVLAYVNKTNINLKGEDNSSPRWDILNDLIKKRK